MMGLSTRGSISLGWALVAGRKRVPRPAAGKTALRTLMVIGLVDPVVVGFYFTAGRGEKKINTKQCGLKPTAESQKTQRRAGKAEKRAWRGSAGKSCPPVFLFFAFPAPSPPPCDLARGIVTAPLLPL